MPNNERRTFNIHTGAASAYVTKDATGAVDSHYLKGVASSNVRDRMGDVITAQAQAQMLSQAKGLTMFMNHSYNVPEDVLGTCEDSSLETQGDVVDLVINLKVAKSNERAMKAWKLVNDDKVTLGFSIGGALTDAEVDTENDGDGMFPPLIINGLDLREISLCGIPANPRSYTRSFVEEIAKGSFKTAVRSKSALAVLTKSLLGEDEMAKCASKDGCEEEVVADTLLCAKHAEGVDGEKPLTDAPKSVGETADEPVRDADAPKEQPVKTVDGAAPASITEDDVDPYPTWKDADKANTPELLKAFVKKMKIAEKTAAAMAIGHINDAISHGGCPDVINRMNNAKDALNPLAEDAEDVADGGSDEDMEDGKGKRKSVVVDFAKKIEAEKAEIAKLSAEKKNLVAEISALKATPTGRQTANPSGSKTIGATPDLKKMTEAELYQYNSALQQVDARASVA